MSVYTNYSQVVKAANQAYLDAHNVIATLASDSAGSIALDNKNLTAATDAFKTTDKAAVADAAATPPKKSWEQVKTELTQMADKQLAAHPELISKLETIRQTVAKALGVIKAHHEELTKATPVDSQVESQIKRAQLLHLMRLGAIRLEGPASKINDEEPSTEAVLQKKQDAIGAKETELRQNIETLKGNITSLETMMTKVDAEFAKSKEALNKAFFSLDYDEGKTGVRAKGMSGLYDYIPDPNLRTYHAKLDALKAKPAEATAATAAPAAAPAVAAATAAPRPSYAAAFKTAPAPAAATAAAV